MAKTGGFKYGLENAKLYKMSKIDFKRQKNLHTEARSEAKGAHSILYNTI